MTDVKRPYLLPVECTHECRRSTGLAERASLTQSVATVGLDTSRQAKTQSLVLPSAYQPRTTANTTVDTRASIPASFEQQFKLLPSFKTKNNQLEQQKRIITTSSPPSSSSNSTSNSSSSVCLSSASSTGSIRSSTCNTNEIDSPSLILPYLYVGDQAQTQIDTISNLNISYILSLQSLPKFLSNSPQSTPPATPTTGSPVLPPKTSCNVSKSLSVPTSSSNPKEISQQTPPQQHNNSSHRLQQSPNPTRAYATVTRRKSENSLHLVCNSNNKARNHYHIINGGDGGLLPSVNSSKDYLVKIKPLNDAEFNNINTSKNVAQVRPKLARSASATWIEAMLTQPEIDENKLITKAQQIDCETNCDIVNQSKQTSYVRRLHTTPVKRHISDDLSDSSMLRSDCDVSVSSDHALATTTLAETTTAPKTHTGRSIKQRCNKISSSVHRLIKGKCINISDTFEQLVDKFFDETHSFIEEARRNRCNVLVHCKAGISRSPTIAIAYLMKWKQLHLQDAYNFVKRCRPQISPNLNFMGQLVSYDRRLQRDRSHLPSPTSCCLPSPRLEYDLHVPNEFLLESVIARNMSDDTNISDSEANRTHHSSFISKDVMASLAK